MRKFIVGIVLLTTSSIAVADDWIAPLLGGMILGNVFSNSRPPTYNYYTPPPTTIVYSQNYYNPPLYPTYTYPVPQYRTQYLWDSFCGCYRSFFVQNY
jgi:hypothetical protein